MLCPVCGDTADCSIRSHPDFEASAVYSCRSCSHRFAAPEPDAEWLASYYRQTYGPRRRKAFGLPYRELMKRRALAQVRFIQQHLADRPGRSPAGTLRGLKVFDVGCGIGALVAMLQSEGAEAEGCDGDPSAIAFGRRQWSAKLCTGTIEEMRLRPEHDLICLSHVMEHLPDLHHSFQNATRGLARHGYLFVEVPNTPPEPLNRCLDMESHIHFFSISSLSAFLEKSGFAVLACTRCGPPTCDPVTQNQDRPLRTRCRRRLESVWHRVLWWVNRLDKVRTPYDGYFEKYYAMQDQRGIWIRCLAVKGNP